jgi:enterochelin esterase-like enzyme
MTAEIVTARWVMESEPLWLDGDTLTFVFQGDHDAVDVCCTVQMPMTRFADTDLWVLSVRIPQVREVYMSYGFMPHGIWRLVHQGTWRGPGAAPSPPRSDALRGTIRTDSLDSKYIGERRGLTVYLPPERDPATPAPVVYVADGQGVAGMAAYLEPFILSGTVPPVVLVGIHSGLLRHEEYTGRAGPGSLGDDPEAAFLAHERFFIDEVMPWAERQLNVSGRREDRAVTGFSNGAVFAAAMALRHPELLGHAMPFSCGACGQQFPVELPATGPRFYFLAGLLEPSFHRATIRAAERLHEAGYEVIFRERRSGHDPLMWNEQFGDAVRWAFGERP